MIALGINPAYCASSALIVDGVLVAAISEERLSRVKNHAYSIHRSVRYLLASQRLTLGDIDCVVVGRHGLAECMSESERSRELLDALMNFSTLYTEESHHGLHALAAYCSSPFDDAAIVVLDGLGTVISQVSSLYQGKLVNEKTLEMFGSESVHESCSIWSARGAQLQLQIGRASTHFVGDYAREDIGIGRLYSYASKSLFSSRFDAGKVMGLSGYGNVDQWILESASLGNGIYSSFTADLVSYFAGRWKELGSTPESVAATIQAIAEVYVCNWALEASRLTGSKNLCLSGGVALNCPANSMVAKSGLFHNVSSMSAPSDDGLAIGAAIVAYRRLTGEQVRVGQKPYLGAHQIGVSDSIAVKRKYLTSVDLGLSRSVEKAAKLISDGEVVFWHHGASEFGPRALGHRSILASPLVPGIRVHINAEIKHRELFRPLAPVVLEDSFTRYFEGDVSDLTNLMLAVAPVKREYTGKLREVLHVDGTARVQTVSVDACPALGLLLQAFCELSGYPILLNTSLNGNGQPICETAEDTLSLFEGSKVAHAFIDGVWYRKSYSNSQGDAGSATLRQPG